MKVRMLTTVAGVNAKGESFCHEAGEEYDLPAAEAKAYVSIPQDMPRAEPVTQKRVQRAETR